MEQQQRAVATNTLCCCCYYHYCWYIHDERERFEEEERDAFVGPLPSLSLWCVHPVLVHSTRMPAGSTGSRSSRGARPYPHFSGIVDPVHTVEPPCNGHRFCLYTVPSRSGTVAPTGETKKIKK